MPAPYSNDLRLKAVEAYARGEGSQSVIANRFSISLSAFKTYWKRYEKTGTADFIIGNKGRPSSIQGKASEERLLKLVAKHPDATLAELCDLYNAHKSCAKAVIPMVMFRALKRLGVKRKKKSHYAMEQDRPDIQEKRQKFKKRNG